jgi:hypothetical protein
VAARSAAPPIDTGRAAAAYQYEFAKWEGMIEAAANDPSLTPEQRAGAVAALRQRQHEAADGVRRWAMEDERQMDKARRRAERNRRRQLRHPKA